VGQGVAARFEFGVGDASPLPAMMKAGWFARAEACRPGYMSMAARIRG
jgi:hypothetical protein